MSDNTNSIKTKSILGFLMLLNILNIVDRNLLSSFGPQIVEDLQLTDSQFGLLTGIIFVVFYAVMGLFMGGLVDRFHRPRIIAAGLVIWSALTAFSGITKSFAQLAVARLLVGVGESSLTPASLSMLSDLFPQRKRGMAAGIYYLGVPLGAGGSFIVAGLLGPSLGWRNCFLLLGALGIVLAIPLFFMRDPKRGAQDAIQDTSALEKSTLADLWQYLLKSPPLMLTMAGAVFLHIPIGGGQFALLWLVRERGFDSAEIATLYGSLFLLFGTIGSLFGGMASDWYQSRYAGGRVRFLAIAMFVMTPLLLGYRFSSPDSPIFFVGMCTGFLLMSTFYGPAFSTVQDLTPTHMRGRMVALLLVACNLIGLGLGAVLTGFLSDWLRTSGSEQPLTWALVTTDIISLFTVPSFIWASIYIARQQKQNVIDSGLK
jgi:MFS family permease